MISLFLDTSSSILRIYLVKNSDILFSEELITKNNHSEFFLPLIQKSLEESNIKPEDVDKIYTVIGPGSFTGTRIGVTVSKTFAYSINKNVIPVSSLKMQVLDFNDYDYYVSVIKDRKDNIYYGIYNSDFDNINDECYSNIEELRNELDNLNGKILIVSDEKIFNDYDYKTPKINIFKTLEYYKDSEINSFLLKPNYLKKIEVESKL